MIRNVKARLFCLLAILCLVPLAASYLLVDDVLNAALQFGLPQSGLEPLADAQTALKRLKHLDPERSDEYRRTFENLQSLRLLYENSGVVRRKLRRSFVTYYAFLLSLVVLLSLATAWRFGRDVSRAYDEAVQEWAKEKERSHFLETMAHWQEVAKRLAHEINNALTPLETLVTGLFRTRARGDMDLVGRWLAAEPIVQEELQRLKSMIGSFAELARLPCPVLHPVTLGSYLRESALALGSLYPRARLELQVQPEAEPCRVALDPHLLRQVLSNLIVNALEANPNAEVPVKLECRTAQEGLALTVENEGVTIPKEIAGSLFEAYVSTKAQGIGRGLGLAITRKIVLEHGARIECLPRSRGAAFQMTFPILSQGDEP